MEDICCAAVAGRFVASKVSSENKHAACLRPTMGSAISSWS
jgi:hypothetical protein